MNRIIEIAEKEIGQTESPVNTNRTKYGKWFGFDGVAWCAIFVSWVYDQAGQPLGNIGFKKGFAGCQTGYDLFLKKGWITKTPVAGDIVLFDWNGDKRYDHTGIFEKDIDGEWFYSIEGNTSLVNDSNGGSVMRRKRKYSYAIFARPKK